MDAETGEPLGEILRAHPEMLGTHPLKLTGGVPELPVLIKMIDAKRDLSVQVHPDDAYALEHEGCRGKTEMWVVLEANPGAEIVYGFLGDPGKDRIREAAADGSLGSLLRHVSVRKGDVFFIRPGTVHALGAGIVAAEIQQSSNLTYRLYDYGRLDRDGKKRPLHVEKAIDVLRREPETAKAARPLLTRYRPGSVLELLARCRYFQTERVRLLCGGVGAFEVPAGPESFHVLLCTDGSGALLRNGTALDFRKGDCIFVPAGSGSLTLTGEAEVLHVRC